MPERRFERIVDELRSQITSGRLRAGDRVPSTRQIMRDWGVAIATASKALATLQEEDLVSARPGVGTLVASKRARAREPSGVEPEVSVARILASAIAIADAEGLGAVSMRRIAVELGVATMALYRHVRGKGKLLVLMADHILGETPLPATRPQGWRPQLELVARLQWAIYRRHPWLARVISMTRPDIWPNGMRHTEWALRAVADLDLDPTTMLLVAVTLFSYVRGSAMNLEMAAEAEQETGLTDEQWVDARHAAFTRIFASGRYPTLEAVASRPVELDAESLFEFGLSRLLDGYSALLQVPTRQR
jgi:DNA-binding transcriptional regulator YhcF (GntR family)